MATHQNQQSATRIVQQSPTISAKDPSLGSHLPATSKGKNVERIALESKSQVEMPFSKRCCKYMYNKEDNSFCGRTCKSWLCIVAYSIMYFCFLCTYTFILLYCALTCIKLTTDFKTIEKLDLLTYSEHGVGLSVTPTSELSQPLIWYRKDHGEDYQKYVNALDNLLVKKRRKRQVNTLGPCGVKPYGYGDKPCVILRINKQLHWSGKPLEANSTEAKIAPLEVRNWLKKDKKLWLHCDGYHSYDKEHIGRIRYFPDPPGFDPKLFPLDMANESPLVAVQISDFTFGISLSVECKLWYANGPSSVEFMLYIASDDKTVSNRSNV